MHKYIFIIIGLFLTACSTLEQQANTQEINLQVQKTQKKQLTSQELLQFFIENDDLSTDTVAFYTQKLNNFIQNNLQKFSLNLTRKEKTNYVIALDQTIGYIASQNETDFKKYIALLTILKETLDE